MKLSRIKDNCPRVDDITKEPPGIVLSGAKPSVIVSSNPLSGGKNAHGSLKNSLGDISGQRSR